MTHPLPPSSLEAEEGVLGSLLIDPDAIALVADFLASRDFYREAHRLLFETMLTLWTKQEPADYITICDELERQEKLKAVGGAAYVTALINAVPTSGNVEHYSRIVAQKALYRRLIHAAGEIAAIAYREESDALETAEQLLFTIGQHRNTSDFTRVDVIMARCMQTLDTLQNRQGENVVVGVPTAFRHLDTALGGLQRSDLVVLAACPGVGKTSFALNVAANAVYHHQQRVAIFSLEMSKEQLGMRLLSMTAPMDQQRLRMGWVEDDEWGRLIDTMGTLSGGSLWIDDTAGISVAAMRSKARRLQAQHGIDLIIVDYLQLMHATLEGKRFGNREQEISEISRNLKAIAKELNVPVLALAQLSRAVESRQSKIPQLSDLRESGAIENDADVVLFIYREDLYNPENEESRNTADIIIAKHRNGPVGTIRLGFDPHLTRFRTLEITPGEDE